MRFGQTLRCVIGLLGLVSLLVAGNALARQANLYTLQESISEALVNNHGLRAQQETIHQAENALRQARAGFLPKLSMNYSYNRQSEQRLFRSTIPGGGSIATSSRDNYQWRGSVTQPLFTGFALLSSYDLARLGVDESEMGLELEELDLALRVKEAYFNILIADKSIEVAEKDVTARQSSLKVARSFHEVGMIPINEVLRAEVELANAEQNLVKARNAARLARCVFNTVLSRPVNATAEVEDILAYQPAAADYEGYATEALEKRPEIRLLDNAILQSDQQIRLAKSQNYPEVALVYDYIKEGDDPDVSGGAFHDANRWQVTAAMTWTFWEWGKTLYSVKQTESLRSQLIKNKSALEDSVRLEVKRALLDLLTATENIPTTQKAVTQGEENLRVNEERYKAQVTTITDVLEAQTLLTQARVNHFRALYDHNLAKARLERAVGKY